MPQCPVCKTNLKSFTRSHIDSKTHKANLKKVGIDPSIDPSLELIKKPTKTSAVKKGAESKSLNQISSKITKLEDTVEILQKQQIEIINRINFIYKRFEIEAREEPKRELKEDDIFRAIGKCVQNNENQSRWVKLDDVISLLKLNREGDRTNLNNLLIKMFNRNLIDLAEGGDPKYPLIYQNRIFGMITRQ